MSKKLLLIVVVLALLPLTTISAQEEVSGTITLWGWTSAIRDTIEAAGIIEAFQAE